MAGSWDWTIKLQVSSKLGMSCPREWQIFGICYNWVSGLSRAHLLNEIDNLLLGGVARDEVVKVRHDVHADVAGEVILGSDQAVGCEDEGGEEDEDLDCWNTW